MSHLPDGAAAFRRDALTDPAWADLDWADLDWADLARVDPRWGAQMPSATQAAGYGPLPEAGRRPPTRFNLLRRFSILSLVTILATGGAMTWFLTHFLTRHMLMQDAEVSRDFIESIVTTEKSRAYLEGREADTSRKLFDAFVEHIPTLPDVVRANLYATDGRVIWSTDKDLVGRRFSDNDELEKAAQGEIALETGLVASDASKAEHVGLEEKASRRERRRFVEAYLPIRDEAGSKVLAVIEVYKVPRSLFEAIDAGVHLVWLSAAVGGLVLYGVLFSIVWRAHVVMRDQREQLVEAETLAAIGEMAAAVAHGIRNPLASIRSTAEIAREEDRRGVEGCLDDIMRLVDRVDGWIRELLAGSGDQHLVAQRVDVGAIVRECLEGIAPEMRGRHIALTYREASLPAVRGSRAPLTQALSSLLSNAVQAMPEGGRLAVESRVADDALEIVIEDTGRGMSPAVARRAFRPLFTTKPNGIGLGLALARRIVERHAGRIDLESQEGRGTRVVMRLPAEA